MQRKHPRYYKGKLLKSEDFTREEAYHEQRLQQLNLLCHNSGILRGLRIKKERDSIFQLTKGQAIDAQGQLLQVEQDMEIDLRELDGFRNIRGNQGYITITYEVQVSDETYCEYSNAETHKEYDSYIDSWKLHIHEERPQNALAEALFHKTILYQDDVFSITQYFPISLPLRNDIPLFVKVVSKERLSGKLEYQITSSHYETKQIKMDLQSGEYQRFDLKRLPFIGGKAAQFKLSKGLLIVNQQDTKVEGETTILLPYSELLKEDYRNRLYDVTANEKDDVVLAKVQFTYTDDQLTIMDIDEQIRVYSSQPSIQDIVNTVCDVVGNESKESPTSSMDKPEKVMLKSGIVPVVFEENGTVFYSTDVKHELGYCKCDIEVALEVQKDGTSRLYQGDISLFLDENIQIAVCQYPTKGTFQLAMMKPNHLMNTKYQLHWFAKKCPQEEIHNGLHLVRLQPGTITLQAKQSCSIVPVFNEEGGEGDVLYEISDSLGGEISTEGIFKAGNVPGIYQIKAKFLDDVVYAYIKVSEKQHE